MFNRSTSIFTISILALLFGAGSSGCLLEHTGVPLKTNHGAETNAELGISPDKQAVSRVELEAGGTSNPCIPTRKLAVLGDGSVYCWRKAQVNGQCPPPFKYQGQIPTAEAQSLLRDTREEMMASDPPNNEGCAGGWSSISLIDQERRRYHSIDLSCQAESLMQQNNQRLNTIWQRVCEGNVGPQEDR